MPIRKAEAEWNGMDKEKKKRKGNLIEGAGRLKVGSGAFDGPCGDFQSALLIDHC